MGQLIYSMIVSLDGYVADTQGNFDWAMPDEEVLAAVNAETATVGTYLYGRRMYQMMMVWEIDPDFVGDSPGSQEYARLWQQANKVVYSTQLAEVETARTELRRQFDPLEVQQLKESSSADISIDGPTLAAEAFRHELVDRIHSIVCPVVVGGGLPFLPEMWIQLELLEHQSFKNGMVRLQYEVQHTK
ncbi:MAG TPA: dihydrofolate reductase family protein [Enteractinococcus sp.]